ncbi:Uma2 family endonuclease [Streptomyces sp. NPDC050485]|uniref:Uma2 family endonuclease n=1 Tax=Streptomyces sp. NPDC050485 TaxID=3365617 RepID=UPI0037A1A706
MVPITPDRPTAMDADVPYEELLRTVEELNTPDGYKAELIRGKIVVSPWAGLHRFRPTRLLRARLEAHAPARHDVDAAPFLFAFAFAGCAYGPDLHVANEAAFEAEGRHADGGALSLVADFTSISTEDADWEAKVAVYGQLVPVYLVLDTQAAEITCLWDPSPRGYRSRTTVPFGRPLHIPAPFDFELDTAELSATPAKAGPDEGKSPSS